MKKYQNLAKKHAKKGISHLLGVANNPNVLNFLIEVVNGIDGGGWANQPVPTTVGRTLVPTNDY